MGHFVNDVVTAGPIKQVHEGLNTHIATYTLDETASGSTTIAIMALPAGAQMAKVMVRANHAAINAGAAPGAVRVYPTIGGTSVGDVLKTSTLSYQIESGLAGFNESGLGVRLTASANLIVNIQATGTGTASTQFTIIAQYVSELDGD
jgi:hypothetical protein